MSRPISFLAAIFSLGMVALAPTATASPPFEIKGAGAKSEGYVIFNVSNTQTSNGRRFRNTRDARDKLALDVMMGADSLPVNMAHLMVTYANEFTRVLTLDRTISVSDLKVVFNAMDGHLGTKHYNTRPFNTYPSFMMGYAYGKTASDLGCVLTPETQLRGNKDFLKGYLKASRSFGLMHFPLCSAVTPYPYSGAEYTLVVLNTFDDLVMGGGF